MVIANRLFCETISRARAHGGGPTLYVSTVRELFSFLWKRKLWWLIPLVVSLLLIGGLLILGQATGVGPLIYTLF
jgi:hypothetical protein